MSDVPVPDPARKVVSPARLPLPVTKRELLEALRVVHSALMNETSVGVASDAKRIGALAIYRAQRSQPVGPASTSEANS